MLMRLARNTEPSSGRHTKSLGRRVLWTILLFAGVTCLAWAPTLCDRYDRLRDFSGVVVTKEPMPMDSRYGSGTVFFLRVRTDDGSVIRVHVSEHSYRTAIVGMRITQRRGGQPELQTGRQ